MSDDTCSSLCNRNIVARLCVGNQDT